MPTRRACVLVIAGLMATASLAQADGDQYRRMHRTELTLGTLIGSHDIGHISGPAAGLHTELGKHFGDIGLIAQYDLMGVGDTPDLKGHGIRGMMHRIGLSARYSAFNVGKSFIAADFWLEGGLGREFIQWDGGGKLTRNDFTLGVGVHPMFMVGDKRRYLGYFLAFRMFVSESPDARFELPATCAGPCDEPTRPPTTDYSFFFNFGFTFGR